MTYVFDTNSFQQLFRCYSRARFPSLWNRFDALVAAGNVTSCVQVFDEIQVRDKNDGEMQWANAHSPLFPMVTGEELEFLQRIYEVPQFRHVVPLDVRDQNLPADPFLIARADFLDGMVVTQERESGAKVRIPFICRHFDIPCGSLDSFMEAEKWIF